jgi:hypothetical protein
MIRQFVNAYKALSILFAGNLLLLAVLGAEWQYDKISRENFASALRSKRHLSDLPAALPELDIPLDSEDAYKGIIDQPLFLEGRHPVETSEETRQNSALNGALTSAEMTMSLSGIAMLPDSVMVLLTDKAGKHFRVKKGESIQGWEVESVQDDKIVMINGTERREILLRDFAAGEKATGAPTGGISPPVQSPRKNENPLHGRRPGESGVPTGQPVPQPDQGRGAESPAPENSNSENTESDTENQ